MANIDDMTVTVNAYLGTCKDCRWWGSHTQEWGKCELTVFFRSGYKHPDSKAFAHGVGYSRLGTAPDFGCVQFEAKE